MEKTVCHWAATMTSFKVNGLVWHQEKRLPAPSCHLTAPWPSLDICFLTAIKTKTKKSQPLVLAETRSVVCMLNINSSSVEHTHTSALSLTSVSPLPSGNRGWGGLGAFQTQSSSSIEGSENISISSLHQRSNLFSHEIEQVEFLKPTF